MSSQKTQIIQRSIGDPIEAQNIFNETDSSHRGASVTVVATPSGRWWCSCYYTVPSGVLAITQRFGADCDDMETTTDGQTYRGLAEPGLKCAPACYQIAYCVTKQSCTYEGVVKSCPTIDNVMIDCELTLVFQIGPDPQKVRDFVYKLGAMRMNEFLAAATDEAMRQLVRGEKLENVLELRGSAQAGVRRVMETLNHKFRPFGITFLRAVIKDVKLGKKLEELLENTTNFKTKIRDVEKDHDLEMKRIRYEYEKKLAELERDYDRRMQDLDNDKNVALIDREKHKIAALSKKEVNLTKANEERGVALQRANADLSVVTMQAKKSNEELLAKINAECEAKRIAADRDCQVRKEESKELIDAADNSAKALVTEAQAEGRAASQLKTVREWELQMAKLEVEEAMARRSKIVISGANGDRLLGSMLDKGILGDIKLNA